MIIQIEHALSENDCRRLMEMYDRYIHLTKETDYTGHPVLYWFHLQDVPGAGEIFRRLVGECLRKITGSLQLPGALYPETVILATMGPGGCHPRHADNCRQNEQGDWVPNHTPQRDVSAIYYLNSNFEGGEIVFEQQRLTIKPRRGLLVAFPSDHEHIHAVVPVRSGLRYTMPIWFTQQEPFALAAFAPLASTVALTGCVLAPDASQHKRSFEPARAFRWMDSIRLGGNGLLRRWLATWCSRHY